ncbi:calcium-binding protein [Saccharibacillus sp. CPCC 101409]|uniref:calcium-binding protein n=1 Tax=Saccharibacillus sp. CPCC 101409 TaxID=3058041 RepID=UPI0026726CD8|nr:calcium-binding protein [Saccharibacillus sp. CPCC 101409]MDO3409466.1 calcium-binding protein [Saccharibacillus sp. CPCC 101409]
MEFNKQHRSERNMNMPTKNKAKLFKVTCSDWNGAVRGRPYRKLAIDGKASLESLAINILYAFDFDMDHMFGFYDNLKNWTRSTEGYESMADYGDGDGFPGTQSAKVAKVFHTPKQKMLMLFDYGDEWRFIVQFLGDETLPAGITAPAVLESVGEAPEQYPDWEDEDDYEEEDDYEVEENDAANPDVVNPIPQNVKNFNIEARIRDEILVDAYEAEERAMSWYTYLQDHLSTAFDAKCAIADAQSPLQTGEKVRVLGLAAPEDCTERIRAKIEWEKRQFAVPLEQLAPTRLGKDARQALEDWVYWRTQGYLF